MNNKIFDEKNFKSGMKIIYKGKSISLVAVDFTTRQIGFYYVDTDKLCWVHYSEIDFFYST